MLFSDYRFTLDLHKTQSQISIPVTLGDTARKLYISFSVRGVPYVIKDGCRAVFSAKKADGTTLFNDCIIEDNMTVRYDFTANTATAEGITDCRILLYGANGRLLATPRFIMVVDKKVVYDDEIAVSDSERTSIDNMMLAETARVNAEAERVASEMARTTAENDRVSAESVRAEAESQRLSEEKDRQTSEKERIAAETARVSAEKTRVDNETTRVSAENQRNSNEQTRTASETGRIDAEKKRVSAEDLRIESETTRVQSEALRKSAEILRNQNESKRESNETERISAEAERVDKEQERIENENIRIENEGTRQALHEEMKTFFDGVENVLTNKNVAQEFGDDPNKVLSQKAITENNDLIYDGIVEPVFVWESGLISGTGTNSDSDKAKRTRDYIAVNQRATLFVKPHGYDVTAYVIEYTVEKTCIARVVVSYPNTYTPSAECVYFRLATYSTSVSPDEQINYVDVWYESTSLNGLQKQVMTNQVKNAYAFDHIALKSINHRGYNTVNGLDVGAPENTLPAYRLSKQKGFDFVECDLALTADGIWVLLHDDTINRTARNADGSELAETVNISDITLKQARQYNYRYIARNEAYANVQIPTFEEFIILCRDIELYPYIEVKDNINYTQEQIDVIIDIVKKYNMENAVTYISFNRDVLEKVRNADKNARLGFVSSTTITQSMLDHVRLLKNGVNDVFLDVSASTLTIENMDLYESNGFKVEVYCPNTIDEILGLDKRISGVTSDMLIAADVLKKQEGIPDDYTALAEQVSGKIDKSEMFDYELSIKKSKNLFDKSTAVHGSWWNSGNGFETPTANQYTGKYIAGKLTIGKEKALTFKIYNSHGRLYHIFAFNSDGELIESITPQHDILDSAYTLTIPENTVEIKFNISSVADFDAYKLMINEGEEALPYEDFGVVGEQSVTIPGLNIDFQETDAVKITLGKHFYGVVGDTLQIFYDSIFEGDWENKIIEFDCPKGRNFPRYFEVTPTSADVGEHDITVIVYNNDGKIIAKETSILHIAEAVNPASKKNILCVGDSTMENGIVPIEASRRMKGTTGTATAPAPLALSNINFVGRKKNPDSTVGWEGTGGWRYADYISAGGTAVRIDVENAFDLDMSSVYEVNNFKLQIAEINVTDGVGNVRFLFHYTTIYDSAFDSTPTSGTMTKVSGNGQDTIEYTNLTIEKYQPFWNSETNAFDILTYANTYCGGQIDFVCTLLGINDCIRAYAFDDISPVIEDAKVLFRSIHAQLPDCKIIASTLPKMSVNGGLAANYTAANQQGKYNANGKNQIVSNFNRMLNALLDEEEFAEYLIVSNSHAQFDAKNGYPTTTKALNTRVTATETLQSNGVHPKNEGYWQLSDAMAFRAVICNIES